MADKTLLSDDPALFDACGALVRLCAARRVTLGCAESCTGGLVSGCLTAVPGSSAVVRGGVVSYAVDVKRQVLGVDGAILDDPALGAVSSECAAQMAQGARSLLSCDVAVSLTGIAGPGGAEPHKPVGTVWMGVASPQGTRTELFCFPGDREQVRHQAVAEAVRLLYGAVVEIWGAAS